MAWELADATDEGIGGGGNILELDGAPLLPFDPLLVVLVDRPLGLPVPELPVAAREDPLGTSPLPVDNLDLLLLPPLLLDCFIFL